MMTLLRRLLKSPATRALEAVTLEVKADAVSISERVSAMEDQATAKVPLTAGQRREAAEAARRTLRAAERIEGTIPRPFLGLGS